MGRAAHDSPASGVGTATWWTLSRAVLAAAVLGTALAYPSDDMLNLAVPSLARDLDASLAGIQWILNSYYVTLLEFVLVAALHGDPPSPSTRHPRGET